MAGESNGSKDLGQVNVQSEIGALRQVLMHYPDSGIGNVVPSKAQEWLYEDIVELDKMRLEYANFRKLLLAYMDPDTLRAWFRSGVDHQAMDPSSDKFLRSDYVVEVQDLLARVLEDATLRIRIVSAVCAVEQTAQNVERILLDSTKLSPKQLANTLITGQLPSDFKGGAGIFAPLPNFVFTRDIGISIHDSVMLSRFATPARTREALLSKYVFTYQVLDGDLSRVIELTDDTELFLESDEERNRLRVTIEGGDVMMISPQHLVVGCSERTSPQAIYRVIESLFTEQKTKNLQRVSVVKIPKHRSCMHIDTVFTQVSRDTWVLFGPLARAEKGSQQSQAVKELFGDTQPVEKNPLQVIQFINEKDDTGHFLVDREIYDLESLLAHISHVDYKVSHNNVNFIYSGGGRSPEAEREQWTDSCNVVCIKEGVVVGYKRNLTTAKEFAAKGYKVVHVDSLVADLHASWEASKETDFCDLLKEKVGDKALLLIEAGELSRARGGPHCMTMPLRRDPIQN